MPKALNEEEEAYTKRALAAGIMNTEILNVLVMSRISRYAISRLVDAMSDPTYEPTCLTPIQIQEMYTECKVGIQQVFRTGVF